MAAAVPIVILLIWKIPLWYFAKKSEIQDEEKTANQTEIKAIGMNKENCLQEDTKIDNEANEKVVPDRGLDHPGDQKNQIEKQDTKIECEHQEQQ